MSELPIQIHTVAQVRALERYAIEQLEIPGYTLMTRAGEAALRCLRNEWPQAKRVVVVCGAGNNAGDGYVLARLAAKAGLRVTAIALFEPAKLSGDALTAWRDFAASGCQAIGWLESEVRAADVIVDAIFGTGLSRPLDAGIAECVKEMNSSSAPILALDVPSGLDADTGQVLGVAIKATRTIAFVGLKLGFYLGAGPDHIGIIEFDSLGVPDTHEPDATESVAARRIADSWLTEVLQRRARSAHKGSNGRALIVGGGRGMAGAVRLAGEAALRVGAGLVVVATRAENVAAVVTDRPELIVRAVESAVDLQPLIAQADVIAIGPGLGQDEWARALYAAVLASNKPLIVDADALNLLSIQPQARGNWVLTPHPAEAGRLLNKDTAQVQADRRAAARAIAKTYQAIVVLKGACSLVVQPEDTPYVCDRGNPGMATAGMGDVLTGVIAGLAAQLRDHEAALWSAARAGVLVHAEAGDAAAIDGERGLIASDLFAQLRARVNPHA